MTTQQILARMDQQIANLAARVEEGNEILRALDAHVRSHGEQIAAHSVQIGALDHRITEVSHRANWIGALNATLAATLTAIISILKK